MKIYTGICLLALGALLSGCSSMVRTVKHGEGLTGKNMDEKGMYYYLPKAGINVVGNWNSSTGLWDFTATPVYFPDVDAGLYEAKRNGHCLFDDDLTLATQNGLLQTVTGTSTDESGNSLGSLAAAAATAYSFGAGGAVATAAKAVSARAAPTKKDGWDEVRTNAQFSSFQSLLVPANFVLDTRYQSVQHHTVYLLSPMAAGSVTYARFDLELTNQSPIGDSSDPQFPPLMCHRTNKYDGVLVRDLIPYSMKITGYIWSSLWVTNDLSTNLTKYSTNFFNTAPASGGGGGVQQSSQFSQIWTYNLMSAYMTNVFVTDTYKPYTAYSQTVMLPDTRHTRLLRISRRPLVTDSTKLTLVNGVVQNREDVRPSEFFGWVSLPKTLVNAIVPFFGSSGNGGGGGSGGGGNGGGGGGANGGNGGGGSNGGQGGGGGQNGGGQGGQAQANGSQSAGGNSGQPISPPIQ